MKSKLLVVFSLLIMQLNAQCWSKISSGLYHNLAIAQNGTLWAWGYNNSGQVGDGTTINKIIPTQISTETNWVSAHAGYYHSFAIKSDGTLWGWGLNTTRQLGDGTNANKVVPTQIGSATNWAKVSGGENFSVGIKTDGTLWVWGSDDQEQMGNGTGGANFTPTQLGIATDWSDAKAGRYHVIALKNYNRIYTWGYNGNGQIGNGFTGSNQNVPYLIPGLNNFIKIEAGVNSSFAIKDDNTLYMSGLNSNSNSSFTQIMFPMTWSNVKAGQSHVIGLKSDGTLWAWGSNSNGQIAQPGFTSVATPYQISGSNYSTNIGANIYGSVALKADGSLYGCGQNHVGQLADNTTVDKTNITAIACPTVLGSSSFNSNLNVKLFPNPAQSFFQISFDEELEVVEIYCLQGQRVLVATEKLINISHLARGVYIVKIVDKSGAFITQKLIKE